MSTIIPSTESLKKKAELIRKFVQEKYGVDLSRGHSLELISQIYGLKDWNTASALSKRVIEPTSSSKKTVGDLRKALEKFQDSDLIDSINILAAKELLVPKADSERSEEIVTAPKPATEEARQPIESTHKIETSAPRMPEVTAPQPAPAPISRPTDRTQESTPRAPASSTRQFIDRMQAERMQSSARAPDTEQMQAEALQSSARR